MLDDCLSDELMKEMMELGHPPEGKDLIKILDQWFGSRLHKTNRYIAYRFLSWLIRGRVNETIHLLEKPGVPNYSHLAKEIRAIGNKRQPNGAGAYIAKGLWGWLCAEIGNPSWTDNGRGVLIVELPTTTMLEAYMEMIGGSYGENGYFTAGFFKKEAATQEQFDVIRAITEKQKLGTYYLFGGGCWVSPRTVPLSESVAKSRESHHGKGISAEVQKQLHDFIEKKNCLAKKVEPQAGLTEEELIQLDVNIESEADDQMVFPQESREKDGFVKIKTPYIIEVKTKKLYDIAADPSDFKAISTKEGHLDIDLYKINIRKAGYHGYHRDHPRLGPVVAAFEWLNIENINISEYVDIDIVAVISEKNKQACNQLEENMEGDRGRFAADMIRKEKCFPALFSDIEADVYDFFYEEIHDKAEPVWGATIYDPNDENNPDKCWPVQAWEYEGVFFAWALESDPEGYFDSLEATKEYILINWPYVRED